MEETIDVSFFLFCFWFTGYSYPLGPEKGTEILVPVSNTHSPSTSSVPTISTNAQKFSILSTVYADE